MRLTKAAKASPCVKFCNLSTGYDSSRVIVFIFGKIRHDWLIKANKSTLFVSVIHKHKKAPKEPK